jgi:hypothetical protein
MMSEVPPAANGTTKRIGRAGYSAAGAADDAIDAAIMRIAQQTAGGPISNVLPPTLMFFLSQAALREPQRLLI